MSTVTQPQSWPTPSPAANPFRYGFRDVPIKRPDGTTDVQQIPLTLEDLLHPQLGDKIVESTLHDLVRDYLADVCRSRTVDDPTVLVLSNTGIDWDDPELRHHAPDVAVIRGVRRRKDDWPMFYVAQEGVRPSLMIEVVSPNHRVNDVDTKFRQYHKARVPIYVILDRLREEDPWELRGYQYTPQRWLEMPKDDRGRLWLEAVGIWLGVEGRKVICYDGETDQPIGDYTQITRRLAQEQSRAEAERSRADAEAQARQAAEARLQELEAELARLRVQAPP